MIFKSAEVNSLQFYPFFDLNPRQYWQIPARYALFPIVLLSSKDLIIYFPLILSNRSLMSIDIPAKESAALRDLAAMLGKEIPPASGTDIHFGFTAKNGHITTLALSSCDLTNLPESIANLAYLRGLILEDNKLSNLPQSLGGLVKLERLMLSRNPLVNLPEIVGQLTSLKKLDLERTELKTFPTTICQLQKLQELNLSNNAGEIQPFLLPDSLCNLHSLKKLDLSENILDSLPRWIGQLTALEELELWDNNLPAIPEEICQLAHLRVLDLSHNRLLALPTGIKALRSLQELLLEGNQLTSLPDALLRLPALQHLAIDPNLAESSLIQELNEKQVEITLNKRRQPPAAPPTPVEQSILISQDVILAHLSSDPIDLVRIITDLGIVDREQARSLQRELRKLEISKKIFVQLKEGKKLYYKQESP